MENEDLISYVKDRQGHDFRYATGITKISRDILQTQAQILMRLKKNSFCVLNNEKWWRPLQMLMKTFNL